MTSPGEHVVVCNGAARPANGGEVVVLDYRAEAQCDRRVSISLPQFVQNVYHLPARTLDLLELASYVFAADRWLSRGCRDAVEYHSWARKLHFVVRVRDYDFWADSRVTEALSEALVFMMGEGELRFTFEPGHSTEPTGLFDDERFQVGGSANGLLVALFSGGVDSLAGVLQLLETGQEKVILASHQASTAVRRTQRCLYEALKAKYPNRVRHYAFRCHLQQARAVDETQRSRSFLFSAVAYALSMAYEIDRFYIFENGVTSINLPRREDLCNSRASRSTHPQTVAKLEKLYSLIAGSPFSIEHPFVTKTKTEVVSVLCGYAPELLSSTVSCTRASFAKADATHCGKCFQCIDRRIATFACGQEGYDHQGLYECDIACEKLDHETKTVAIDYIRQAIGCAKNTREFLYENHLYDLSQVIDYLRGEGKGLDREEAVERLFERHGQYVQEGLSRMRSKYDDVFRAHPKAGSLLGLVAEREYLKSEVERLAVALGEILAEGVQEMFATNRPKDEADLNGKIGALLRTHDRKFRSEYPTVSFACANVIPDHQQMAEEVIVEAKYIRGKTTPAKATEGIAADLTKYPQEKFKVFVVYDPEHRIRCDSVFKEDFENRGNNRVIIIR